MTFFPTFPARTVPMADATDGKPPLLRIFLLALVVRVLYLAFIYDGEQTLLVGDSQAYISMAEHFLVNGLSAWSLTERVPGYMFVLLTAKMLFGVHYLLATACFQAVTDAISCVLMMVLAGMIRPRLATPAGLLAAVNLNLTVHVGLILNDSLFLTLLLAFLCALGMAMRHHRLSWPLAAGILLGMCILMRSVAMFLPLLLPLLALATRRSLKERLLSPLVAMLACGTLVAPWIIHNGQTFGRYQLVSQGGVHLAYWVVPLTMEYGAGVPAVQTTAHMRTRVEAAMAATDAAKMGTFTQSDIMTAVAKNALKEAGIGVLIKAWAAGGAINVLAPPILSSPPVSITNRPSFFATEGDTPVRKVLNYLGDSRERVFKLVLFASLLVIAAQMALTVWGLAAAVRRWPRLPLAMLAVVSCYFIAITGPITGVKYRLPLEPLLILAMAEGCLALIDRLRRRSGQ